MWLALLSTLADQVTFAIISGPKIGAFALLLLGKQL
jgi:hypothetical protein